MKSKPSIINEKEIYFFAKINLNSSKTE